MFDVNIVVFIQKIGVSRPTFGWTVACDIEANDKSDKNKGK